MFHLNGLAWVRLTFIFFILGPLTIRWYGLLFALGFLLGQQILIKIYKQEGKSEKHVETLTVYMVLATIIGARLGHCLFYQPDYYLVHPLEILKIWEGGLASHGAAIGILFAIYLYSKKVTDQSYFYVLDRLVITIALAGCLIRLGNLMNSEIIGKPADIPTAFLFVNETESIIKDRYSSVVKDADIKQNNASIENFGRGVHLAGIDIIVDFKKNKIDSSEIRSFLQKTIVDSVGRFDIVRENVEIPANINPEIRQLSDGSYQATVKAYAIPRHPAQLYESLSSLVLFLILYFVYNRKKGKTPEGRLLGIFIIYIFSLRFIYEFFKENQVEFESELIQTVGLNIGQLLSIPLVIAGLFILMRSFLKKNEIE